MPAKLVALIPSEPLEPASREVFTRALADALLDAYNYGWDRGHAAIEPPEDDEDKASGWYDLPDAPHQQTPEDASVINKLVNAVGNVVDDMTFCVAPSKATLKECTKLLATVGLIQKLKAATGPDRDLDMTIARALGFRIAASTGGPHIMREGSVASWDLPAYTATAESRADAIKKLST